MRDSLSLGFKRYRQTTTDLMLILFKVDDRRFSQFWGVMTIVQNKTPNDRMIRNLDSSNFITAWESIVCMTC